jgi:hypothetical protein
MGTNILAIIGLLTIIFVISFGSYKIISYIRSKQNPLKEYIRKIVLEYLKELSNDEPN